MAPETDLDLLILGSGVAGLSAAARAARSEPGIRIGIVTKGRLEDSATQWAQGGVAAVLHEREAAAGGDDSPALHAEDTMRSGAGLCDRAAVDVLVNEGPARVRELIRLGAEFDRHDDGRYLLSREGGHTTARVVHAGGAATGAEVERALVEAARASAVDIREHCLASELIIERGSCRGVLTDAGAIRAAHTLLATGGAGHLYPVTTNPPQATGDGLAMAIRAGVAVADLEFIQFHPTALNLPGGDSPRPLLSEALRGDGALLRDEQGHRFVDELQPRDVVAAAIAERGGAWLDVSPVEEFATRFPNLDRISRDAGLAPPGDWLPVAPAAHYICGGVLTDLDGATTIPGLWAAGEVACSGVHGANRLASNSLVEGMVFAVRAVEAILSGKMGPHPTGALLAVLDPDRLEPGAVGATRLETDVPPVLRGTADEAKARETLQRAMMEGAGVMRSAASLAAASADLFALAAGGLPAGPVANLLTVAMTLVASATARTESRGGHRRRDYPSTDPALSRRFFR
ncbi:MAG TPA: FAD-binding protein [Acidimicrobiales bacterium]|nr:FAD-binding protein [Acidimicrobiales bacterium]